MEKYTVGQIAKAIGVSAQTLRHYESLGLISSMRNDGNQYRTYSLDDTRILFMISIYRSMGFSLPKIKQMLKDMNEKDVISSFDERLREVDTEIRTLELLKFELERYRQGIEDAVKNTGKFWIENKGHKMVSVMKSGSGMSLDNDKDNELVEYQKLAPHVRQGFVISKDSFKENADFDYQYGVLVSDSIARQILSEEELEKYMISIEGPLAKTIIRTNGELLSKETFKSFFEWIEMQGYEIVSDLYGTARYHAYYQQETTLFEFLVSVRMR